MASARFRHPRHVPPAKVDDLSDTDVIQEMSMPSVERRAVTFSEARLAVRRLAQGDPGGWTHLMTVIADVNQPLGDDRSTLLHLLVIHDQGHMVRALLDQGADPSRADRHGVTPMALNESQHRRPNYQATRDALRSGTVVHEQKVLRQAMQAPGAISSNAPNEKDVEPRSVRPRL